MASKSCTESSIEFSFPCKSFTNMLAHFRGCYWHTEWPSGLYSLRQVTEVKLGRVRSNSGWVTSET